MLQNHMYKLLLKGRYIGLLLSLKKQCFSFFLIPDYVFLLSLTQQVFIEHLLHARCCLLGIGDPIVNKIESLSSRTL